MSRRHALALVCGVAVTFLAAPALAAGPLEALSDQLEGGLTPALLQLVTLITVLALVPSLLVMATSFTKFVVVLSVLRSALGLQQSPPNMVIVGLAMFLTLFVMQPTFERAWQEGIGPYLEGSSSPEAAFTSTLEPFRSFMAANVREKDLALFEELAARRHAASLAAGTEGTAPAEAAAADRPALTTLIPAFMTSELRKAFTIAFLIFVPFLVIEMIVSSVLMAMGMMMLPPVVVSLPFKLIFFVLVDGWWLLGGSLVRSYG
ncbi:flagellar type III secretion system pore protein FliP [Benzoatithermus flavus]|uniref:Flagellar biosynthetic protein FliP n=1 Tax=Benzoatithermus flavus TaxID=3108223 RepID=A0ABU8XV91_9PROT